MPLASIPSPGHTAGYENYSTFQPVFAYQSLWAVAVGFGVIWASRTLALTGKRTFMLCAAAYAVGGFWVEAMRIGPLPQVPAPATARSVTWWSSRWPWLVYT